jgi:hypothetical protein
VPDDNKKRAAQRALADHVLNAAGRTTPEQRARAFRGGGYSPPMGTLIDKVATRPTQITDEDFAAAKKALFTEDQVFELVICAAVGESARRYDAGLAALTEAAGSTAEATGSTADAS